MNNTDLCDQLAKTDPRHTKKIVGKPYSGTSPSPHWLVRLATEVFGPCGEYWGLRVDKTWLESGLDEQKVAFAQVRFWWRNHPDNEPNEIPHIGGTVFCGRRKNGDAFIDEDAYKKSVTDGLVKAMSLLGFAADIFSGLYDDSKYVADVKGEFERKADTKAIPAQEAGTEDASDARDCVIESLNMAALDGVQSLHETWKGFYPSLSEADRNYILKKVMPDLKKKAMDSYAGRS